MLIIVHVIVLCVLNDYRADGLIGYSFTVIVQVNIVPCHAADAAARLMLLLILLAASAGAGLHRDTGAAPATIAAM